MKKTFLAKRNALLSSTSVSWGTVATAIVVFFLLVRLLAPNFFWQVFAPVFRVSDTVNLKSHAFFSSFGDAAQLSLQNEKLSDENDALTFENQALIKKIESLSGLSRDSRGITAGVVARPPESPYDSFVLAGGSDDGISLGMEVFGDGGVPLGVVSSVLTNFSRATLFSAPGISSNGWVGRTNLSITITGAGAGVMTASVPRSAGIEIGDIVFMPGPGMFPVGAVVRVDSDISSPSVILRIMPAVNLFSIAWVTMRDTGVKLFSATSTLP